MIRLPDPAVTIPETKFGSGVAGSEITGAVGAVIGTVVIRPPATVVSSFSNVPFPSRMITIPSLPTAIALGAEGRP
jgi:hypothetical protein